MPAYGDIGVERGPERTDSTAARSARTTLLWLVVVALSVTLTACGSARRAQHADPASTPSTQSAGVTPLPTPQSIPVGTRTARQSLPTQQVLAQINVVCSAVLHGFPAPPTRPFTRAKLVKFANAALTPARRTAISLLRLESVGDARALSALGSSWQQLDALYGSIATLTRNARAVPGLGQEVLTRQAQLATLAESDRVPACAVRSR